MDLIKVLGILCLAGGIFAKKSPGGVCVTKLVKGKFVQVGDCQKKDGSEIARLIKENIEKKQIIEDSSWYEGKRYVALTSKAAYKAEAITKCQNIGGDLANLYNQDHMDEIMDYIRQYKMDDSSWKYFHLGMTYDPINQILRLRDGTPVSISDYKWYPGLPYNGTIYASYTNMVIGISSDPSYAYQYLYNWPDVNLYVLCEI